MINRFEVAAIVLGVLTTMAGCKPKVGGKCKDGQYACMDKERGVFCEDGKFAEMSCRGPDGCKKTGTLISCDNTLATIADGCATNGEIACATDKQAALECKDHKYVLAEPCKGTRGCEQKDNKFTCDNSVSEVGDPCHFNGDYACSADKSQIVRCVDNKMTPLSSCRGPQRCTIFELPQEKRVEFSCDDTIAQENDPCDQENEPACSVDGKSLLLCKSKKYAATKTCTGSAGCRFEKGSNKFFCSGAVAATRSATHGKIVQDAPTLAAHGAKAAAPKPSAAASSSAKAPVPPTPTASAVASAAPSASPSAAPSSKASLVPSATPGAQGAKAAPSAAPAPSASAAPKAAASAKAAPKK